MRALFDNKVLDATLSSLYGNVDFPASNIKSPFLNMKFKSMGINDTVRALFPANITADCFFYGYTNAESMTVRIYSHESVLLDTISVDCTYQTGSAFFTKRSGIRWIDVEATSPATEDLYIGGFAFGESVLFPDPIATFEKDVNDKSNLDSNDAGQVSYQYIRPLLQYRLNFKYTEIDHGEDIFNKYLEIGGGLKWIDITENNHERYRPIYCTTEMNKPTRDRTVDFSMYIKEAR